MATSVLEEAKIQARVLVPLVKALRAELGEQKANAMVRQSLGPVFRDLGERWWKARRSDDLGQNLAAAFERYAAGQALQYRVLAQSPSTFEMDVTECRYAQFFHEIGAPELGFLLMCSADFDMAEGFGPDIRLTRTQTIMQGASHCDFRYRRLAP